MSWIVKITETVKFGKLCKSPAKPPSAPCGTCCKAQGIVAADLENKNAKFGSPQIFVGLTEWCDKIIME